MHLSDFADFANVFIRERSKQSTSELSLMVIDEMVYTTVNFFNKFQMFAQKLHSPYFLNLILVSLRVVFFFLIGIHSMQGWAATTRHGVTRKRGKNRLKLTGNLFRKDLQLIGIC